MCNEVLEFIQRRFSKDCDWINGNCYYFALILSDRFPGGTIYYDVINGHFVYYYGDEFYDWTGIANTDGYLVEWNDFEKYDAFQKNRVVRDCLL